MASCDERGSLRGIHSQSVGSDLTSHRRRIRYNEPMRRRNQRHEFTPEERAEWEIYGRRLYREAVLPNLRPGHHGYWAIMGLYTRDYEIGRVFAYTLRDLRYRKPEAFVWVERVDMM